MVLVATMAALVIDVGLLLAERTKLQSVADASVLAGAALLPDESDVVAEVEGYVLLNDTEASVSPEDIVVGHWDAASGSFDADAFPHDAVRVIVRRDASHGNAVPLYFARIFGVNRADVAAHAIATGIPGTGHGSRFMIDDEMIDSDIPVIEALAASYEMDSEEIISDNDGDGFIDLPPGEVLELPTGQVGDEGMFDIDHPEFPFTTTSDPSFEDFLRVKEDGRSVDGEQLVPKDMLDPLLGVSTVSDGSRYASYVDPEFCQVSPVHKSDISDLDPVDGTPAVNALGYRRGLLAFKILGVGDDPDGGGSQLPNLVIEICDPADVNLATIAPGPGSSGIQLRLVR